MEETKERKGNHNSVFGLWMCHARAFVGLPHLDRRMDDIDKVCETCIQKRQPARTAYI
jgi:hypothetical protein